MGRGHQRGCQAASSCSWSQRRRGRRRSRSSLLEPGCVPQNQPPSWVGTVVRHRHGTTGIVELATLVHQDRFGMPVLLVRLILMVFGCAARRLERQRVHNVHGRSGARSRCGDRRPCVGVDAVSGCEGACCWFGFHADALALRRRRVRHWSLNDASPVTGCRASAARVRGVAPMTVRTDGTLHRQEHRIGDNPSSCRCLHA